MNAKEKAEELVNKFMETKSLKLSDYSRIEFPTAKQCALICCDEVLGYMGADRGYEFWTEVKEELLKM
jgi:hypothetical protein